MAVTFGPVFARGDTFEGAVPGPKVIPYWCPSALLRARGTPYR